MAQVAESNTIIIQTNFRLLYFAMENIKGSEQHDINYWNRLQTIMYAEIDKNAMYNKEFLKRNMTQMMMFYCKEVKDINRDFYDEVCRPIEIPKGYKGCLYIKDVATEKYKNQEEVLFKRGFQYKIKSVNKEKDRYYIKAEAVL